MACIDVGWDGAGRKGGMIEGCDGLGGGFSIRDGTGGRRPMMLVPIEG